MLNLLKTFLPRLTLGIVGAGKLGVGDNTALSTTGVREGKTGEQVVGQAHGKYFEGASRGTMFAAVNVAAGGVTPTSVLSTTGPFTLYNPLGSSKLLSIKKVGFAQGASGTLGSGTQFHCVYSLSGPTATQGGTVPTGTAVTPVNCLAGSPLGSVATVLETVTFHTTNPAALYPFLNESKVAGGTIAGNSVPNYEDVDGAIVLGPGSGWTLEGISSAVSSPLCWISVVWEEVPIP